LLMNTKSKFAILLFAAALAATAFAQQSAPVGGIAAASEPGKAAVVGAPEVSAQVVAIDKATRTVTLKGPKGNEVTLDVRKPEQFNVVKKGDQVEMTYTEALALAVEPAPNPAAARQ
jgi:hypothetical protein